MRSLSISPNVDFAISVLVAVLFGVSTGALPLSALPPDWAHVVVEVSKDLVQWAVYLSPVFPMLSSARSGFAVPANPIAPDAPKVLAWLAVGLVGALLLVQPHAAQAAGAQPPRAPAKSILSGVSADVLADIAAAKALADAQRDSVASACYAEIQTELAAQQAAQSGALPPVHLFYSFQLARGLANAALPTSTLATACAPLAQQVKMSVLTLVNGLVSGGIGLGAIGPLFGLP